VYERKTTSVYSEMEKVAINESFISYLSQTLER
jgi:hypothetical protein